MDTREIDSLIPDVVVVRRGKKHRRNLHITVNGSQEDVYAVIGYLEAYGRVKQWKKDHRFLKLRVLGNFNIDTLECHINDLGIYDLIKR